MKKYKTKLKIAVIFPSLVVPTFFISPYFVIVIVALVPMDPLYFILEEYLENAMYRDLFTIYAAFVGRTVCCFLGTLEGCRFFTFLLGSSYILLDRVQTAIIIFVTRTKSFSRFHFYYTCYFINFKRVESWFNLTLHLALSGVFWITVANCWVTIRGRPDEDTDLAVYGASVLIFLTLVVVHALLLPRICEITQNISDLPGFHKLRAEIKFSRRRLKILKIKLKQANCIMPFRLRYGEFWYLGKEFITEHLYLLQMRCFDAIMVTS